MTINLCVLARRGCGKRQENKARPSERSSTSRCDLACEQNGRNWSLQACSAEVRYMSRRSGSRSMARVMWFFPTLLCQSVSNFDKR